MTIKAVIFDMGGVFLRSESESGRRKWELRLGLAEGELASIVFGSPVSQMATVGRTTDEAVWNDVAARFRLDDEQLRQLRRDFWSGDRMDAELVRYLGSLRPRYKTALLNTHGWARAKR